MGESQKLLFAVCLKKCPSFFGKPVLLWAKWQVTLIVGKTREQNT